MWLQQFKERWVFKGKSTLGIGETYRPWIRQIRNHDSEKWEAPLYGPFLLCKDCFFRRPLFISTKRENFINADHDSQQGVFDQISVLSDIVAVLNEHDVDPTMKRPHVSSILIDAHEHDNHPWWQSIANWLKCFGWIALGCGSAFLLYRLFGGQTIIKNVFIWMGLPPWAVYLLSGDFLGICSSQSKRVEKETYEMVNIENQTLKENENQRSSRN